MAVPDSARPGAPEPARPGPPGGDQLAFPCASCGAELHFQPGTTAMRCPYCGRSARIEPGDTLVEEHDYLSALDRARHDAVTEERIVIDCPSCSASTTFDPNVTTDECPFCGTKIVAQGKSTRLFRPGSLLPFKIDRRQAADAFKRWLRGLWFAPNALKQFARLGGLTGVYCPYWTYDCRTVSRYTGQRGEYYYETETYTTTENGRTVRRTRQKRHTRWYPAAGTVRNAFDDVLVVGSRSLPKDKAEALEPWDLDQLVAYDEEYLSGFKVESYQVDLEEGFGDAQRQMEPVIRQTVRRDIGGDTQRIHSLDVKHHDITFKHLLLPVWVSAYRYRGEVYRFLVNARSGEVQGERPWSWIKITFAVFVAVLLAYLFFSFFAGQ